MSSAHSSLQEAFVQWSSQARNSGEDFIVAILQRIFQEASRQQASDVHIQPARKGVNIRMRLDGVLHQLGKLPIEKMPQIASRMKVLAELTTYKTSEPQEGRIRKGDIPGVDRDIRLCTAPSLYGERISIRFFSEGNKFLLPIELGFTPAILKELSVAIQRTNGAILITGPTGNGKTTTACALLRALVNMGNSEADVVRSVISLEDPVEHAVEDVAQVEVARDGEMTLDRLIRYLMRQDPDVIMVGEIRDKPTAEAAFQAALTGHLLISTFHAGDTAGAISRLLELGVEPFTIRSSLTNLLCQRLLRQLCPCAARKVERGSIEILGERYEFRCRYEPVGCPKCSGTGYGGRMMIAESMPLNSEAMGSAILARKETAVFKKIGREQGMLSFGAGAIELIESGKTSPMEIIRVLGS